MDGTLAADSDSDSCYYTDRGNGASLWSGWVTNNTCVSVWDNKAQKKEEIMDPSLEQHPYAMATRWAIDRNVLNSPPGWSFIVNEYGQASACPENCKRVLFGLMPGDQCSVTLFSYNAYNERIDEFVACLYQHNSCSKDCMIDYNVFGDSKFNVTYDLNYNTTWDDKVYYGEGSGDTSSGGYLEVFETITSTVVAPLEVMYDADGHKLTEYETPVVYECVRSHL